MGVQLHAREVDHLEAGDSVLAEGLHDVSHGLLVQLGVGLPLDIRMAHEAPGEVDEQLHGGARLRGGEEIRAPVHVREADDREAVLVEVLAALRPQQRVDGAGGVLAHGLAELVGTHSVEREEEHARSGRERTHRLTQPAVSAGGDQLHGLLQRFHRGRTRAQQPPRARGHAHEQEHSGALVSGSWTT